MGKAYRLRDYTDQPGSVHVFRGKPQALKFAEIMGNAPSSIYPLAEGGFIAFESGAIVRDRNGLDRQIKLAEEYVRWVEYQIDRNWGDWSKATIERHAYPNFDGEDALQQIYARRAERAGCPVRWRLAGETEMDWRTILGVAQ